jgi:hypothetical protein
MSRRGRWERKRKRKKKTKTKRRLGKKGGRRTRRTRGDMEEEEEEGGGYTSLHTKSTGSCFCSFFFGSVWGEEGINVRSRSGVYEHVVPILMKGKGGREPTTASGFCGYEEYFFLFSFLFFFFSSCHSMFTSFL